MSAVLPVPVSDPVTDARRIELERSMAAEEAESDRFFRTRRLRMRMPDRLRDTKKRPELSFDI